MSTDSNYNNNEDRPHSPQGCLNLSELSTALEHETQKRKPINCSSLTRCRPPDLGKVQITSRSRFENLPGEIRNQIYGYLLSFEYCEVIPQGIWSRNYDKFSSLSEAGRTYKFHTAIMQVSKLISDETRSFYYSNNLFVTISTDIPWIILQAIKSIPFIFHSNHSQHVHATLSLKICSSSIKPGEVATALWLLGDSFYDSDDLLSSSYHFTLPAMRPDAGLKEFVKVMQAGVLLSPLNFLFNIHLTTHEQSNVLINGTQPHTRRMIFEVLKKLARIQNITWDGVFQGQHIEELEKAVYSKSLMGDDLLSYFDESMTETFDLLRKLSHHAALHLVMQACEFLKQSWRRNFSPDHELYVGDDLIRNELQYRAFQIVQILHTSLFLSLGPKIVAAIGDELIPMAFPGNTRP